MDYGNILGVIFENMAKLLPIRTVHDYQQGLRWTFGKAGKNLKTGWKFFMPLVQSVDIIDQTVSSIDLHPQVIRTSDDKQIAIRSGLEYRILDAKEYFLNLQDNDAVATVRIVARGYIAAELSKYSYKDIWTKKEDIEIALTERLQEKVTAWGLDAQRIHIAEYPEVRSHRLFGINDQIPSGE
ncbi:SPFH domain-containing protein [Planctomycetota bacterium]